MIANFGALNVREPFFRLTTLVARLVALLLLSLSVATSGWAQLPCVNGSLPTGDPNHSQQLIQICIPPISWNGQLVIYLHGFVEPQAALALPTQELEAFGGNATIAALLQRGFAFATTSFRKNGYVVEQGAQDVSQLLTYFKTLVAPGSLHKTYLVGGSEGGLIATLLVEQHAQTYDGALSLCAPLGGAAFQTKYLGDFRVVFDYFFPSVFRDEFKAFEVPPIFPETWSLSYVPQVATALQLNPSAANQLFKVTRVALNPANVPGSAGEAALSLLRYSILETPDLKATAGGTPFDNRLALYLGSNNDFALNRGVERVTSDPQARAYLRHFYQPTGRLQRPLVSLHTTLDPLVPFSHELIYLGLATLSGHRSNLTILPTASYGHCNFQPAEVLGAFGVLVSQTNGQLSTNLSSLAASAPKAMQ